MSSAFEITYRKANKRSVSGKQTPLDIWAATTGIPRKHWESLGITEYEDKFIQYNYPNGWAKARDVTMTSDETTENGKKKRRNFWINAPPGSIHPLWPTPMEDESHEEIWIAEGESDVATLRLLGLDAYTYGSSTNVPGPVELRQLMRLGVKRAIILFDADEPGQTGAPKLEAAFASIGVEPLNLDINMSMLDLDYAKDVRDMYSALGDVETLKRLKRLLLDELGRQEVDLNYQVQLKDARNPEWVWDGLIAQGGLTLLYGPAKTGKTTLVYQMLRAMREGGELLTRRMTPQRVLYYSEMPQPFDYERARMYLPMATDEDPWFFMRSASDEVFRGKSWPAISMLLAKDVARYGITYVILDTANEWLHFEAEEIYSVPAVTEKLRPLRRLAADTGCTVQINTHPPKAGGGPFGSIAFQAYVDCLLELSRDTTSSTLRAIGRIRSDFESVKFRLEQKEYAVLEVDDQQDVTSSGEGMKERIMQILPIAPNAMSIKALANDPILVKYSEKSIRNCMNDLLLRGIVTKIPGEVTMWQRAFSFEIRKQEKD